MMDVDLWMLGLPLLPGLLRRSIRKNMIYHFPVEVQNLVLHELSPMDRTRYSLSNRQSYQLVSSYNRRTFRVRRILSRYFDTIFDIVHFRHLQYELGMLISGSSALQFFDGTVYPKSDLDVYVELGRVELLVMFLLEKGYVFVPVMDQPEDWEQAFFQALETRSSMTDTQHQINMMQLFPQWEGYAGNGMAAVFNFAKRGEEWKHIQVITCRHTPLEVILHFHSTCVMSIISHSHAYSLYPHATFEDRVSIHTPTFTTGRDKHKRAREKYARRGWEMAPTPSALTYLRSNSEFRNGMRCVGDSKCWIIPLEPLYEPDELIPDEHRNLYFPRHIEDDPVRAHIWSNETSFNKFKVKFQIISSQLLKHKYCVSATFRHQINQLLPSLPTSTSGDVGLAMLVHELCKSHNRQLSITGEAIERYDPIEDEVQAQVQELVSNAFIRMEWPRDISYDLLPRATTALTLLDVLKSVLMSFRKHPEVKISFSINPGYRQRESLNDDPPISRCVWTDVTVRPPDFHQLSLNSPFNVVVDKDFIDELKKYRIILDVMH